VTAEIVNLRRTRKAHDRAARSDAATASRIAHGRSRAERETAAVETARAKRLLEGHRLSGEPVEPGPDGDGA